MGRATKLTPERQRAICDMVRDGVCLGAAAEAAGVSSVTVYRWRQSTRSPYREFAAELEQALGEAEARYVNHISQAAETTWQAAAWMLERRWPKRWGRRDRLSLELAHLSDEELDARIEALERGETPATGAADANENSEPGR